MFWASGDIAHRRGHGTVWSNIISECCCHKIVSVPPGPGDQGRLLHDDAPLGDLAPAPDVAPAAHPLLSADLHPPMSDRLCSVNMWVHFVLSCSPGVTDSVTAVTACVVVMIIVTMTPWRHTRLWAASWLLTLTIWGQTHNVMSAIQQATNQRPESRVFD